MNGELASGGTLADRGEMLFGHAETDPDRFQPVDRDQRLRSVGRDQVALVYQQITSASTDRGVDLAVTQVESGSRDCGAVALDRSQGAFNGGLIGADRSLIGLRGRGDLIVLRSGNNAFLHELRITVGIRIKALGLGRVARLVGLRLLQDSRVALERSFRQLERMLVWTRVDFKK